MRLTALLSPREAHLLVAFIPREVWRGVAVKAACDLELDVSVDRREAFALIFFCKGAGADLEPKRR